MKSKSCPIKENLLKSFDIREITKEAGLKFLGRRIDVQS